MLLFFIVFFYYYYLLSYTFLDVNVDVLLINFSQSIAVRPPTVKLVGGSRKSIGFSTSVDEDDDSASVVGDYRYLCCFFIVYFLHLIMNWIKWYVYIVLFTRLSQIKPLCAPANAVISLDIVLHA